MTAAARITVRKGSYRGVDGFKIQGTNTRGQRIAVFCRTHATAAAIADCYRSDGSGVDELLLDELT